MKTTLCFGQRCFPGQKPDRHGGYQVTVSDWQFYNASCLGFAAVHLVPGVPVFEEKSWSHMDS